MSPTTFWHDKSVLVTGGHGFLGSYVVEALEERGIPSSRLFVPTSDEADLLLREVCDEVVRGMDVIIHLAARVGGIGLNVERPGELLYQNSLMGLHLMESARRADVGKMVVVGTTCSYPKLTPTPFREETLWDGPLDENTGPYGYAKKLMLVQGQTYRTQYGFHSIHLIPTNLYGPKDHFDERSGHVIPSLVKRFGRAAASGAPEVSVWGTGKATRDFLYVADAAEGILLGAERYDEPEPVNLGTGNETSIKELVLLLAAQTGYSGEITWDTSKPDGQPRRRLDVTRARELLGFEARTSLADGLERTVAWYRENQPL